MSAPVAPSAGDLRAASAALRVWIVDDDEAIRTAVTLLLESAGWLSAESASAEQFLTEFREGTADCLLLDLQMPGMSGAHLVELLRAQGVDIPVIVITAFADGALARRARAAGVHAILRKPFSSDELLREIRAAARA